MSDEEGEDAGSDQDYPIPQRKGLAAAQKELDRLREWKKNTVEKEKAERAKQLNELQKKRAKRLERLQQAPEETKATPAPRPPSGSRVSSAASARSKGSADAPSATGSSACKKPVAPPGAPPVHSRLYPAHLCKPPEFKKPKPEGEEEAPEEESDKKEKKTKAKDMNLQEMLEFAAPKKRKLTGQEEEDLMTRLWEVENTRAEAKEKKRQLKIQKSMPALTCRTKPLSTEEVETMTERLYKLEFTKQEARVKKWNIKLSKQLRPPPPPVNPEQIEEMLERLVTGPKLKSQSCMVTAHRKHDFKSKHKAHKLTKAEHKAANSRLYADSMAAQEERKQKLLRKYVDDTQPTFARKSRAELEDAGARLSGV
eukprot:NODE_1700_length_1244_cov_113.146822_g1685_i0.p1 GENE.NODE_1700_length_1244_cov_113.146822_g1685_i0~~NODE_1700_length_1244_cov_113.146822_g1685_i0.p1  ORF type:complete len:368 (-),score=87.25 NODE_1700_length_1244_cov_113.146822_g1685_i0:66-1169(-)